MLVAEAAPQAGVGGARRPLSPLRNGAAGARRAGKRAGASDGDGDGGARMTTEARLGEFIRGHRELYEDILLYCGVNVDELLAEIRAKSDIEVSRASLVAYLESQGVRAERTRSSPGGPR